MSSINRHLESLNAMKKAHVLTVPRQRIPLSSSIADEELVDDGQICTDQTPLQPRDSNKAAPPARSYTDDSTAVSTIRAFHKFYTNLNASRTCPSPLTVMTITCLVLLVLWTVISRIVLYYRTGSPVIEAYEFYGLPSAALRRWKNVAPINHSLTCPASHSHRPPVPSAAQLDEQISQLISKRAPLPALTNSPLTPRMTVHVIVYPLEYSEQFAFTWYSLLTTPLKTYTQDCSLFYRFTKTQSKPNSDTTTTTTKTTTTIPSADDQDAADTIDPLEEDIDIDITSSNLFDLLHKCLYIAEYGGIEFILIPYNTKSVYNVTTHQLLLNNTIRNLLIISDISDPSSGLSSLLSDPLLSNNNINIGLIALNNEYCENGYHFLKEIHVQLFFAFFAFSDCFLIDNINIYDFPLGTSTATTGGYFPWSLSSRLNPLLSKRLYDLSLMVSYQQRKPTRMQTYLTAINLCSNNYYFYLILFYLNLINDKPFYCYLHADYAFYTFEDIYLVLKYYLTYYNILSRAHEPHHDHVTTSPYANILRQSRYTLCPVGNNPDSYRLWESLLAGSIPLVETYEWEFGTNMSIHAAHGTKFVCRPYQDVHPILYATNAPIIWIRDWRTDLTAAMTHVRDADWVDKKQAEIQRWFHRMRRQWRLLMFKMMFKHFALNR